MVIAGGHPELVGGQGGKMLENVVPVLLSLVSGGGLLTFVLGLLQRRDAQMVWRRTEDRRESGRARVYEVAFRHADAWSRQLAQLAGPLAAARRRGDSEFVEVVLGLLESMLGEEGSRGWQLKAHPDFLEEARRELELVAGSEEV